MIYALVLKAGRSPRICKCQHRRRPVWPAQLGDSISIAPDCSAGDLAEVLEFLRVRFKGSCDLILQITLIVLAEHSRHRVPA